MSRNAVYNADVRQSNDQYGAPSGPLTPITVHRTRVALSNAAAAG